MVETLAGVDVSHHQERIDWSRVAGSGKVFAFIKASEGAHSPDKRFDENRHGARGNSIVAGAYHFFRPKVEIDAQVTLFLGKVQAVEAGELPPVLDLEAPEDWVGIPKSQRIGLVLEWLRSVEEALGVHPFVYASPGFLKAVLAGAPALRKYQLWLANYNLKPAIPAPWTDWTFWQYSETGTVDGVNGHVDLDLFNGTHDQFRALLVPGKGPKGPEAMAINAPLERSQIVIATADPIAALAHARTVIDRHLTDVDNDPARRRVLQSARTHLERALASVVPQHRAPRVAKSTRSKSRRRTPRTSGKRRSRG